MTNAHPVSLLTKLFLCAAIAAAVLARCSEGPAEPEQAAPVAGIDAGNGDYHDRVRVIWDSISNAATYDLLRSQYADSAYAVLASRIDSLRFDDYSVTPGTYYYYKVIGYDATGKVADSTPFDRGFASMATALGAPRNLSASDGAHSAVDSGYRLITNLEFFLQCDTTILRSNSKITILGNFGEEIVAGDASGTCHYKTEVPGIGQAVATITYANYRDFYLVLDGSSVSTTDWGGTGDLSGTVSVSGLYPGSIEYHLTIKSKNADGGYYRVCQGGGGCEDIQYTTVK